MKMLVNQKKRQLRKLSLKPKHDAIISLENRPNVETINAIEDVEHGRNLVGPFHSVKDLMEDLNA